MNDSEVADVIGLSCGAFVVGRSGERCAAHWSSCEKHGGGCEEKERSECRRPLLASVGGGEMRSD